MLARGNVGWQDQLLSIMMGSAGGGNADEFVFLGFFEQEEALDHVGRNYGRIGTTYKGTKFFTGGNIERLPHTWYSICVLFKYGGPEGSFRQIYHNGKFNFEEGGNGHIDTNWLPGKNLSIGIREFPMTGVPFEGLMTDVQAFDRFLTPEEAIAYTTCAQDLEGDIVNWSNMDEWERTNINSEYMVDKADMCTGETGVRGGIMMIFPNWLNWYGGREICRRFGGRLHMDRTKEEVGTRSAPMVAYGETLRPGRCKRVWTGATDEAEEGIWLDSFTGEVVSDLPGWAKFWAPGQPNGIRIQNCAGIWEVDGEAPNSWYDDGGCEKERQCSMCNFPAPPRAKLRGMCENLVMDKYYSVLWDAVNNLPYYQGFRNSRIDYNEDEGAWKLYARNKWTDEDVNGTAIASIESMGTGSAIWNFNRDLCNLNTNPPHTLKLTVCSNDEFTCAKDGKCISMDKRW